MRHSWQHPFQQPVSYDAGWISRQLGGSGRPNQAGWHHCRCPAHNGDSLSALALKNAVSGRLLVKCFRGCDEANIHQAIDRLAAHGAASFGHVAKQGPAEPVAEAISANMVQAARIWHSSHPDHLIETYLSSRSISLSPPDDLRLHSNLVHVSGHRGPAIVALVRDVGGEPAAVHRTWLSTDGRTKALLDPNRMALGPTSGCAVRLAAAADAVLVGEGVETTLSAMQLLGEPGWATLSTSGMKALKLPSEIRKVTIAADHDPPGLDAAETLCRRLRAEGRSVEIVRPTKESTDFNDLLLGVAA